MIGSQNVTCPPSRVRRGQIIRAEKVGGKYVEPAVGDVGWERAQRPGPVFGLGLNRGGKGECGCPRDDFGCWRLRGGIRSKPCMPAISACLCRFRALVLGAERRRQQDCGGNEELLEHCLVSM